MAEKKQKKRKAKATMPKRKPGAPIERPFVSRANPLADMLFGSITPEMMAAADRGEEWTGDRSERSEERSERSEERSERSATAKKFSTTEPDSGSVGVPDSGSVIKTGVPESGTPVFIGLSDIDIPKTKGFLALPHALLELALAKIRHYSAFKVYVYLYREAFRKVHDDRLNAKCTVSLRLLTKQCGIPKSVACEALKVLVIGHWIEIENRPGEVSSYIVNRILGVPESGTVVTAGVPDSGPLLKKDDDDFKERRSSSKKGESSVENHRRPDDDDSFRPIKEVYEELTSNTWTKKDSEKYSELGNELKSSALKAEDIIRHMRAIFERTDKTIGSFAYFAKAVLREIRTPKTRKTNLDKLRKIIHSIKHSNVGRADYSNADFIEDVTHRTD